MSNGADSPAEPRISSGLGRLDVGNDPSIAILRTYVDGVGPTDPLVPVEVGIALETAQDSLAIKLGIAEFPPILFIERRQGGWHIGISPQNDDDPRALIAIGDNGSLTVRSSSGQEVIGHRPG
jgi:hypothetical protein